MHKKKIENIKPLAEREKQIAAGEWKTPKKRQVLCSSTDVMGLAGSGGGEKSLCKGELQKASRRD